MIWKCKYYKNCEKDSSDRVSFWGVDEGNDLIHEYMTILFHYSFFLTLSNFRLFEVDYLTRLEDTFFGWTVVVEGLMEDFLLGFT